MHGILADSDEILITNGSQNGIELLLKLLTAPGKKVAIGSPTYAIILPLLKYYQAELAAVPIKKAVQIYTMDRDSPSCSISSLSREELLKIHSRLKKEKIPSEYY